MHQEIPTRSNAFRDEQESDQHARAIQKLANELQLPADEVKRCYTAILEGMKETAKVKAFLPVLVSRSVKERLRHR